MEREKKIEILKIVLYVIAAAGLLSVAMVAPNAVQLFKIFTDKKPYQFNFRFTRVLKQLERRGMVKITRGKVSLTPKGMAELKFYILKDKANVLELSKKWDGKWRLVIFDIWERRRGVRDATRRRLNRLGFVRLQNSVWVYPYECQEVVELLKTYYKLRTAVLYITADSVENDDLLKKKFGLKD